MPPAATKEADAVEKYLANVSADPRNADAHANLGWGYYGKRQLAEAQKSFQDALALNPEHLEAQYGLALAFKASGSKAEAIAAFEKAKVLAGRSEDAVRKQMLARLIRGHINEINTGDWNLGKHETYV
jgi:tetratricopeptide (TPR) repeat protein